MQEKKLRDALVLASLLIDGLTAGPDSTVPWDEIKRVRRTIEKTLASTTEETEMEKVRKHLDECVDFFVDAQQEAGDRCDYIEAAKCEVRRGVCEMLLKYITTQFGEEEGNEQNED